MINNKMKSTKVLLLTVLLSLLFFNIQNNQKHSDNLDVEASAITPPTESDISFIVGDNDVSGKVPLNSKVSIIITADPDCSEIDIKIFTGIYFDKDDMQIVAPNTFGIEIDTESYQGVPLTVGKYGIQLLLYESGSPVNSWGDDDYTFDDIFEIVKPVNYTIYIILAVVGVVAVVGIIVFKKIQNNRLDQQLAAADQGPARKRKIYSGASQIGKRSGQAAEVKMRKRQRTKSYVSSSPSKPMNRRKSAASTSQRPIKSAVPSRTKKSSKTSMDKLPEAVQVKVAESKVAIDKRVGFLDSKIDVLLSQVDLLSQIVPKDKDTSVCNECNNKMSKNWSKCPFCEIKELNDDIRLKESMLETRDDISLCPQCGFLLQPNWVTCPKCLTEK